MKKLTVFKEFTIITLATALLGFSFHIFMIPSRVSIGSVSGLSMVLSQMTGGAVPISLIALAINAVLLVAGFLCLGTGFGIKTVYTSLILPVFLGLYEILLPNFQPIIGDPFQDVLCHLFLVSFCQATLFNVNASSGGLDIIGKLLNKYLRVDLGKAVASCGLIVALMSYFVSDLKIVVLSVLGTYLNGIILDYFIFGNNIKRRVCILSSKLDEIRNFVLNDMHSGATIYEAIGAYNNTPLKEIVVIVNKQEYAALMRFISKEDPAAFVTVYNVNEVSYVPKPGAK